MAAAPRICLALWLCGQVSLCGAATLMKREAKVEQKVTAEAQEPKVQRELLSRRSDLQGCSKKSELGHIAKRYCIACRVYTDEHKNKGDKWTTDNFWDLEQACKAKDVDNGDKCIDTSCRRRDKKCRRRRVAKDWSNYDGRRRGDSCFRPERHTIPSYDHSVSDRNKDGSYKILDSIRTWMKTTDAEKVCGCFESWWNSCLDSSGGVQQYMGDCVSKKICHCSACSDFKEEANCRRRQGSLAAMKERSEQNSSEMAIDARADLSTAWVESRSLDSSVGGKCS